MMREYGEAMATFKPILDYRPIKNLLGGTKEITLKYLTPHNKWSTHSMYFDSQQLLTLFRGGQTVWMSENDAKEIGVRDNDWIELYNHNGVVTSRVAVSVRYSCTMPRTATSTCRPRRSRARAAARTIRRRAST